MTLIFSSGILLAQHASMDSVVIQEILVTSNRVSVSNENAPNKIQVIDSMIIRSLGGNRLSDALKFGDNVFMKDYGFNSGLKTIALNSTQSEQTLILVDGIRLNGRDNAQYDAGMLQLDDALSIEISKGGLSSLYGSEAIGGVVNVITRRLESSPFGISFKGIIGSYGLERVYIRSFGELINRRKRRITADADFSHESARNDYDYHYYDGVKTILKNRENSEYYNNTFHAKLNAELGKTLLRANLSYNYWNRNIPGIDQGYSPSTAKQIDRDVIASGIFERKLNNASNFRTEVDFKYSLRSYYDTATFNSLTELNSYYKTLTFANSSNIDYHPSAKFELSSGYDISLTQYTSNDTEEGKLKQAGVFAASKYVLDTKFLNTLTVYPSIRYDYYSNIAEKNVVTGKLGLNLKPLVHDFFYIKSSIGSNFRAPDFDDLYWKVYGNKDLKPERSISFDAGVLYEFLFPDKTEIEVSYFNVNTTDRIVWTPVSGTIWKPLNIGKVLASGIDASITSAAKIAERFYLNAKVNYSNSTAIKKNEDYPGDPSYGKQMLYIPQELVKTALMMNYLTSSKVLKFVSLNLFYSFTGRRYMSSDNTSFLPGYSVFDANCSVGFSMNRTSFGVKFAVNNILDQDFQVVSGYPMPLRNFRIELSLKY